MKEFELLEFCHVQRKKNDKADALAKLVAADAAPPMAEQKKLYMTGSFSQTWKNLSRIATLPP